jgi:nucleoid-associated protein YgaU
MNRAPDDPQQPTARPPAWGEPGYRNPAGVRSSRTRGLLVAGGIVLVLAVAAVLTSLGGSDRPATNPGPTISHGLASKDATADVRVASFTGPDAVGQYTATIEITNHSDGTSDYYIEVAFEDAGGVNVGWGNAVAQHVEPGQRARVTAETFESTVQQVKVTKVQRTASS